VCLTPVS